MWRTAAFKVDTNDCIQSQNSGNYNSILNTLFNRT